ncbi:GntR family transcriptional regulator [Sphingomonas sp. CJ20]
MGEGPLRTAEASAATPFGSPKQLADGGTKTSLVQSVYTKILEALDNGTLRPGDRIVASDLAQRLGLSRAPVREALAVLAGQGLVELHPDRGAILRPLTLRDLAEIYEVSAPVAALGVRAAAGRIAEGDNAMRVADAMERIRCAGAATSLGIDFYLVLNDYHYLVNAIGEKPYVDFVLRAVSVEYWNRYLAAVIDLNVHGPKYVQNYQRLTDAILAGDGGAAEATLLYHSAWCIDLLTAGSA